jgi:hypothetical protein
MKRIDRTFLVKVMISFAVIPEHEDLEIDGLFRC